MNRIIKLFILLVLLSPSLMPAQEGERVIVFTSSRNPSAETTWTLTLLVAYHEPDDVNVIAPQFAGSLLLEQVRKMSRFYNPSTGQATNSPSEVRASATPWSFEHWTAVEFRFTLNSPGRVEFEAFKIMTPPWQAETVPFAINVQRARDTAQVQSHRLIWEGAPASLVIGENAVFTLRVNDWNSSNLMPETEMFLPAVPPGYILESLPLTNAERSSGVALRLRLIPLEPSPFVLASRRFSHDAGLFDIPVLRIPVNRTPANTEPAETEPETDGVILPFPSIEVAKAGNAGLYQKYMAECETLSAAARNLWERGETADALAALRKSERDHPAGAFFAALRRRAEQTLGFSGTYDEKKGILSFLSGRPRGKPAVIRETIVRRIPNMSGAELSRFKEGQPVLLDKRYPAANKDQTVWVRVISNDEAGISGWVPQESVIFY